MAHAHRVLIVDDDPDIREVISAMVELGGYSVDTAANGREALDRLRQTPRDYCVILLDLMMPIMNGQQFREAQLQDPSIAPLPVVVISATGSSLAATARLMQAQGHLAKPVSYDALLNLVEKSCQGHA